MVKKQEQGRRNKESMVLLLLILVVESDFGQKKTTENYHKDVNLIWFNSIQVDLLMCLS